MSDIKELPASDEEVSRSEKIGDEDDDDRI